MACVPVTISHTSPSHSSTHHSLWCTFCTKWPQELSTWQESHLLWVCSSNLHPCHGTCQSQQSFWKESESDIPGDITHMYGKYMVMAKHFWAKAQSKILSIMGFVANPIVLHHPKNVFSSICMSMPKSYHETNVTSWLLHALLILHSSASISIGMRHEWFLTHMYVYKVGVCMGVCLIAIYTSMCSRTTVMQYNIILFVVFMNSIHKCIIIPC